MNWHKLFFLGVIIAFGLGPVTAQSSSSYYHQFFPVEEVIFGDNGFNQDIKIGVGFKQGIVEDSLGKIYGLWSNEGDERNVELATAAVKQLDEMETLLQVSTYGDGRRFGIEQGDMVEMVVLLDGILYDGPLFACALQDIGILNAYDEPMWDRSTLLWNNIAFDDVGSMQALLEDVQFVAREMRNQMDDPLIESGSHEGESLFDAMENSTLDDLENFFSYVKVKPEKYRGQDWKISEIFATWIHAGSPMPQSQLQIQIVEREEAGGDQEELSSYEEELYLDLKKGTLNKVKPTASFEKVKELFPFYTGETEEGMDYNCGGGVYFLKHDFYFYTYRNYIEVRSKFKGTCSIDLLDMEEEDVVAELGEPDLVPKNPYDGPDDHFIYKMKYGSLVIGFDDFGNVVKVAVHYRSPGEVEICW